MALQKDILSINEILTLYHGSSESRRVHNVLGSPIRCQHKQIPLTPDPTAANIQLTMSKTGFLEVKASNLEGLT